MTMRQVPYLPRNPNEIPLGCEVQDRLTGIKGRVVSKVEYLTGCTQFGLIGTAKEGKLPETNYLDWQRLGVIGEPGELAQLSTSSTTKAHDGAGDAPGARHDAPTR